MRTGQPAPQHTGCSAPTSGLKEQLQSEPPQMKIIKAKISDKKEAAQVIQALVDNRSNFKHFQQQQFQELQEVKTVIFNTEKIRNRKYA